MKSGNLNFLEPSGSLQACNGTDLPFIGFFISKFSQFFYISLLIIVQIFVFSYCLLLLLTNITVKHSLLFYALISLIAVISKRKRTNIILKPAGYLMHQQV